jgi:hypothetical protein
MKAVLPFLAGLLLLASAAEVQSHGGGLDAYDCHHDGKRGGYHCHRGPLAGQAFASKEEMVRMLKEREASRSPGPARDPRALFPAPKRQRVNLNPA